MWRIGLVIASGGALGALSRWLVGAQWPSQSNGFPFDTLFVNAVGSFLVGALMVLLEEVVRGRRYVRPFLGVGVLGGFTTFSTYSVEVVQRLAGASEIAVLYFLATPVAALLAVTAGASAASGGLRSARRKQRR